MTIETETFQQLYVSSIVDLIYNAYTAGLLQRHPLTVAGITVEMTMFAHFNQLAARYNGRLISISMFDNDSDAAQYSSIQNLIADLIV
jgi:hypothetical protein